MVHNLFKRGGMPAMRVRRKIIKVQEWENFYNYNRPHAALNGQTPYEQFRKMVWALCVNGLFQSYTGLTPFLLSAIPRMVQIDMAPRMTTEHYA
jgi:hypothetical protein